MNKVPENKVRFECFLLITKYIQTHLEAFVSLTARSMVVKQ